jgi:hemerythrin-like metal-binding protein
MDIKNFEWDDQYSVGIRLIDEQHRELIRKTGVLYENSQRGQESKDGVLRALRATAEYARYHFTTEELLLEKLGYPGLPNHQGLHGEFIRKIWTQIHNLEAGSPLFPRAFVRYLRDWAWTHVAFIDRKYALYFQLAPDSGRPGTLEQPPLRPSFPFLEQWSRAEAAPPTEMFWG